MLFPTVQFFIFFLFVFIFSWYFNFDSVVRKFFLLIASYFFYSFLDFKLLPILLFSTSLNYFFGYLIHQSQNRKSKFLTLGVLFNLSILGFYKYFDFFIENLNLVTHIFGHSKEILQPFDLILPLGISFYTFQGISFLVDLKNKKIEQMPNVLDFSLIICFFPHLIAGPIVRAAEILPQFQNPVDDRKVDYLKLSGIFIIGLFKKVIISNYIATDIVDPVFQNLENHSGLDLWLALYGYAIQIYCDFSAYSDMAIAVAGLLGYEFPENFNQPYQSESLSDFWRRWHISLSSWLRDYVYIPMGGSKVSNILNARNLMLTMILGGVWHGASWNFIVWGTIHGIALVFEKMIQIHLPSLKINRWMKKLIVFHIVCFAWIFFRLEQFQEAVTYIQKMFIFSEITITKYFSILCICLGMMMNFISLPRQSVYNGFILRICKLPAMQVAIYFCIFYLIISLSPNQISPFIYFRF